MTRTATIALIFIALAVLVVVGGYYLGRIKAPPPHGAPAVGSTSTSTPSAPQRPSDEQTRVTLYYYDPARDQGPGGAQCSPKGLVAVERLLPKTQTPLRDSIALLIRGELLAQERAAGLTTEFPIAGLDLKSASITNAVATLVFDDPQGKTGGGSCRIGILRAQIEATAKQFPTVSSVRIEPVELFQP